MDSTRVLLYWRLIFFKHTNRLHVVTAGNMERGNETFRQFFYNKIITIIIDHIPMGKSEECRQLRRKHADFTVRQQFFSGSAPIRRHCNGHFIIVLRVCGYALRTTRPIHKSACARGCGWRVVFIEGQNAQKKVGRGGSIVDAAIHWASLRFYGVWQKKKFINQNMIQLFVLHPKTHF